MSPKCPSRNIRPRPLLYTNLSDGVVSPILAQRVSQIRTKFDIEQSSAKAGFVVYADDHRGHGKTAGTAERTDIMRQDSRHRSVSVDVGLAPSLWMGRLCWIKRATTPQGLWLGPRPNKHEKRRGNVAQVSNIYDILIL